MQIGHLGWPIFTPLEMVGGVDFPTELLLFYHEQLANDLAQNMRVEILSDPRIKSLEGQLMLCGTGAWHFDIDRICMWGLWYQNSFGKDAYLNALNFYLDNPRIDVFITLWLSGVEVFEPIDLVDDYQLLPIGNLPDSYIKATFATHRMGDVRQRHIAHSAIVKKVSMPKTLAADKPYKLGFDEVKRTAYELALLMNLLDEVACLPFLESIEIPPMVPLGPFSPSTAHRPIYDVSSLGHTVFTREQAALLREFAQRFFSLSDKERSRFQKVFLRLVHAKSKVDISEKVLDYARTLEMLLLNNNSNNESIKLRFQLNGSWLIGESADERKRLYDDLDMLYKFRSTVAHGGELKTKQSNQAKEKLPEFAKLAQRTARVLLFAGEIDWDRLILGQQCDATKK